MSIGKALWRLHVVLSNRITYIYGFFLVATPIVGLAYVYGRYYLGATDFTKLVSFYWYLMFLGVILQAFTWIRFRKK